MNLSELHIPNLAKLGLAQQGQPDLITIWRTPYPVIGKYKQLCARMGVIPFAGGSIEQQGDRHQIGYITSGYRSEFIENRQHSPHCFALAIDVAVGDVFEQITWARKARELFPRIGLYPTSGFVHLDLADSRWMIRYGGRPYWVRDKHLEYQSFSIFDETVRHARDLANK